jgi:hypothetical protein
MRWKFGASTRCCDVHDPQRPVNVDSRRRSDVSNANTGRCLLAGACAGGQKNSLPEINVLAVSAAQRRKRLHASVEGAGQRDSRDARSDSFARTIQGVWRRLEKAVHLDRYGRVAASGDFAPIAG